MTADLWAIADRPAPPVIPGQLAVDDPRPVVPAGPPKQLFELTAKEPTMTTTPAAEPRALTVRQPWAFAIAEGFKPIENRTRRTHYRGEIFLHTSKTLEKGISIVRYSRDAARRLGELGGQLGFWDAISMVPSRFYTPPTTLALSGVIATARITGCHHAGDGCGPACETWGEPDAWHWELANARPLTAAVPAKGALGLWKPPADVLTAVRTQPAAGTR